MQLQICRQGQDHFNKGINNQDFFIREGKMKVVMDGCSGTACSEVGTRLFAQFFSKLEGRFDPERLEENVKATFTGISYPFARFGEESLKQFLVDNMSFTIISCFEMEDKFIIKYLGDGYIITMDHSDLMSYIRLDYGKCPPYYVYNLVENELYSDKLSFKTMEFSKEDFKLVGIASDGFFPMTEQNLWREFEACVKGNQYTVDGIITWNQEKFGDDITIMI